MLVQDADGNYVYGQPEEEKKEEVAVPKKEELPTSMEGIEQRGPITIVDPVPKEPPSVKKEPMTSPSATEDAQIFGNKNTNKTR